MDLGLAEATTVQQLMLCRDSVSRAEGIIPAPEANHAVAVAISEAFAQGEGEQRTILFSLSGHGHSTCSLTSPTKPGKLENYEYPAEGNCDGAGRLAHGGLSRAIYPLPSGFASRFFHQAA